MQSIPPASLEDPHLADKVTRKVQDAPGEVGAALAQGFSTWDADKGRQI